MRKLSFEVPADGGRLRLDQLLAREIPAKTATPLSRRKARGLIADGAVHVDGRRHRIASRSIKPGCRIDVYVEETAPGSRPRPKVDDRHRVDEWILFEDEHLLAVDKPSGIAVQATVDDDVGHLLALTKRFLARRSPGPSPYLALPHRLDRGTSGIQLLAKTRAAAAALSETFRDRRVDKRYLALCLGPAEALPDEWTVRDRLELRRHGTGPARRAFSVASGGRSAETHFTVREQLAGVVLMAARPLTGRTHQIRVHLADSGAPVLGDRLYGPERPTVRAPRLMLHAAELHLRHPVSGAALDLESPAPEIFVALLDELRDG